MAAREKDEKGLTICPKSKKCPIRGCEYETEQEDALFGHLYMQHRKNEVIEALLRLRKKGG